MNKGNKKLYLAVKIKTNKHKLGKKKKKTKTTKKNKTTARCQVGNKAMKRKLTNMLRGKERK